MAIFLSFFLGNIGHENVFYDIFLSFFLGNIGQEMSFTTF